MSWLTGLGKGSSGMKKPRIFRSETGLWAVRVDRHTIFLNESWEVVRSTTWDWVKKLRLSEVEKHFESVIYEAQFKRF